MIANLEMQASDWITLIGLGLTIMGSVAVATVGGLKYLTKNMTSQAVAESKLADSVDRLTAAVGRLDNYSKVMDARLNAHDIEIALLKNQHRHQSQEPQNSQ